MGKKSNTYVIILAAGNATRLRPLSYRVPKPLIEIDGKPLISRIISSFKEAGFNKFYVLIGYKGALIKNEVLKCQDIEVDFVEQTELSGMADALLLCLNYIKNKSFKKVFVTAADIIFSRDDINKLYSFFNNVNADIVLSLMKSKDKEIAKGHGNVKISDDSDLMKDSEISYGLKITDIIEKPKPNQILSDYYSLPLYLFNKNVIKYLSEVKVFERGEKEFQDAIKLAIFNGDNIRGLNIIQDNVTIGNIGEYHLTYLKDILKMNFRFLKGIKMLEYNGEYPTIIEPMCLNEGIKIGDKVLIGPNTIIGSECELGDYCKIVNSIIFDNVIIGKHTKLNNCIIEQKVILPENFQAKNSFITYNQKSEIQFINF